MQNHDIASSKCRIVRRGDDSVCPFSATEASYEVIPCLCSEDVFREIKISAELEHAQIANMREFYIGRKKVRLSHAETYGLC